MFSTAAIVALAKFLKLDGLIENVSGYVEARIAFKIEVREDVAKAITHGLLFAFLLLVFFVYRFPEHWLLCFEPVFRWGIHGL